MNLYLEALDRDVKKEQENPSVGVILCSSKDEDVVEYSISKNISQTMISEYKLKLIDKKLLETKLKEMNNIEDNNNIINTFIYVLHFSFICRTNRYNGNGILNFGINFYTCYNIC